MNRETPAAGSIMERRESIQKLPFVAAGTAKESNAAARLTLVQLPSGYGICGPAFSRLISRIVKDDKRTYSDFYPDDCGYIIKHENIEWQWTKNWLQPLESGMAVWDAESHLLECYSLLNRLIIKSSPVDLTVVKNRNELLMLLDYIPNSFERLGVLVAQDNK